MIYILVRLLPSQRNNMRPVKAVTLVSCGNNFGSGEKKWQPRQLSTGIISRLHVMFVLSMRPHLSVHDVTCTDFQIIKLTVKVATVGKSPAKTPNKQKHWQHNCFHMHRLQNTSTTDNAKRHGITAMLNTSTITIYIYR